MYKSKIWFISDTHFCHTNIIEYCKRPFTDVEEMNETLVDRWNRWVNDNDYVIHCGDVAMGRLQDSLPYIERLNGKKLLTRGNHDSRKTVNSLKKLGWIVVNSIVVNDMLIQHHYLTEEHDFKHVLHGHAHGTFQAPKQIDVGVDAHHFGTNFEPIRGRDLLEENDEYCLTVILNNLL